MTTWLRQARLEPARFDATACNVHTPESGPREHVIVLVHGYNGHGYQTWGRIPAALFEVGLDVAVFDYASGLRRVLGRKQSFEAWADQLGAALAELSRTYRDVFLVGHSLGGLLVETAGMNYLLSHPGSLAHLPLAAIILIGSPRAGLGLASALPTRIVPLQLRRMNDHALKVDTFFSSRVEALNVATAHPGQFVLPSFAVLATNDTLVSDFSASFRIPEQQRLRLTGSHTSIVKPAEHDDALIAWIRDIVAKRLDVRVQAEHERLHNARQAVVVEPLRSVFVTEFWSGAAGITWEEIYNSVRKDLSTADVSVHDVRDIAPGSPVDLLVAVHDAGGVIAGDESVRKGVDAACARGQADVRLTVGLAPVGPASTSAAGIINTWLPTPPPVHMYVQAVHDSQDFLSVMARWLRLVIDRDPRRRPHHAGVRTASTALPDIGDYT